MITVLTMTLVMGLALEGHLGEFAAFAALLIFVIFRAIVRGLGGVQGWTLRTFEIIFYLFLILNVLTRSGSLAGLLPILFSSFFSGAGWVLSFAMHDTANFFLYLLLFFALYYLFKRRFFYKGKLVPLVFYLGIPAALLIILSGVYGGSGSEFIGVGRSLLILLVLLGGIYIMVFNLFSSLRR